MEFLVLFPDGRSFGPASVETLSEWAREGRLLPNTMLENLATRQRVPASSVAGIFAAGPTYTNEAAYPRYNWQPTYSQPMNGMAIASLVLGILSLCSFCVWFAAVPLGLLAVIFGFMGKKDSSTGLATAGIVCGFLGLLVSVGLILLVVLGGSSIANWKPT